MEASHLVEIERRFPDIAERGFLLSGLAPGLPLEVGDPAFGRREVFASCFDSIEAAVEESAGPVAAPDAPPNGS